MLLLELLIYHLHVYDKELGYDIEGKLVNATTESINDPKIRHKVDLDEDQGNLLYLFSNIDITKIFMLLFFFI